MLTPTDPIGALVILRTAKARCDQAAREMLEARTERDGAILAALRAGSSLRSVAAAAGTSHTHVANVMRAWTAGPEGTSRLVELARARKAAGTE